MTLIDKITRTNAGSHDFKEPTGGTPMGIDPKEYMLAYVNQDKRFIDMHSEIATGCQDSSFLLFQRLRKLLVKSCQDYHKVLTRRAATRDTEPAVTLDDLKRTIQPAIQNTYQNWGKLWRQWPSMAKVAKQVEVTNTTYQKHYEPMYSELVNVLVDGLNVIERNGKKRLHTHEIN